MFCNRLRKVVYALFLKKLILRRLYENALRGELSGENSKIK